MSRLLPIILVGLVIRLFLVGNTGFIADISFWKSWSLAAIDHGIVWTTFNTNINYPPGFIYILFLMGKLYSFLGNPHDYNTFWRENNFGFLLVSKSIAIASDVAIAFLIYWFFSQKEKLKQLGAKKFEARNPKHETNSNVQNPKIQNVVNFDHSNFSIVSNRVPFGRIRISNLFDENLPLFLSAVFFLNPVVILDSALWGQVESFGILFTLVAILLLFYRRPLFATAIFTIGALMKLQNIIFIPLFFLFILRYFDLKTTIRSIAVAAATFFLVNLPFLAANQMKQVLYLLTVNSDYFPWLSLNAHNLWWIVAGARGMQISDRITVLGILNAKTVGLLIFSSFYLLCCFLIFKKPNFRNFLLSLTLAIFAFFLFTTQSHERYSYPVIVLLLFLYPFLENRTDKHPEISNIKNQISKKQIRNQREDIFAQQNKIFADRIWNRVARLWILKRCMIVVKNLWTTLVWHIDTLRARKFYLREKIQNAAGPDNYYFWLLYFLLTAAIFFNIHMGLVQNYPQNGFAILTRLTTLPLSILNSYFLIFLFLLLLPLALSQISPFFFIFCFLLFISSLTILNYSYLVIGKVSLTVLKPIVTNQDYGSLQINMAVSSFPDWKSWSRLSNNYFYYRKGFGTHANSYLVFDINRKFKKFSTDYGVDTGAGTSASVVFKIYGDDKELFASEKMGRFDFPKHIEVDILGIKNLGLVVTDAGDGINNDHADWLNPVLYK